MRFLSVFVLVSVCFGQSKHADFTQVLVGVDDKPIQTSQTGLTLSDKPKPMTLGDAALTALTTSLEKDRSMTGAEKFKLDELARKVYGKKDPNLTVEEIALIKTRIGDAYGPVVVGAAWRLLDPTEGKKDEK